MAGCVLLFFSLGWNPTIKFFCIWAVIGLAVYFLYARRRSHMAPGNEDLLHGSGPAPPTRWCTKARPGPVIGQARHRNGAGNRAVFFWRAPARLRRLNTQRVNSAA